MNYFKCKFIKNCFREYILIILTATIISTTSTFKVLCEENIFIIDNIEVEGDIDINFSREKYINKAFLNSFDILMSKILVSSDLSKLNDIKLNNIKKLVSSFKISNETYLNEKYSATFKIYYDDSRVKNLLVQKNISYSQPRNISAVFLPVLFVDDNLKNYDENFFYKNWLEIKIKNELINFILPLEDIEYISEIKKKKNNMDKFEVQKFANKYNTKNFSFVFMSHQNKKLNLYLRTNFNNNEVVKNIVYEIENFNNEKKLTSILEDLKMQITDIWKGENVINLSIPLSIKIKFRQKNMQDLDRIKNVFSKISIVKNSNLEEFNIDYSLFNIYYFGNPKKLSDELLKHKYQLKNEQSHWEIYKND